MTDCQAAPGSDQKLEVHKLLFVSLEQDKYPDQEKAFRNSYTNLTFP